MNDSDQFKSRMTTVMVGAAVAVCAITFAAVVGVVIFAPPSSNNVASIATIVGVSAPILGTFLVLIQQQLHLQMNNRLSQLLSKTEETSEAIGKIKEKERMETKAEEHPIPPIPPELVELGRKIDLLEKLIKEKGINL